MIHKLRTAIALAAVFATPSAPARDPDTPPTVVVDRAAAARLRGNGGVTLQWIGWDRRGLLDVAQPGGTIFLRGGQRAAKGPGRLEIDGYVTRIDATRFGFRGRIVIRDAPDIGRTCVRDGDFVFAITKGRRYWRLQDMERCDGLTDYVDVYF